MVVASVVNDTLLLRLIIAAPSLYGPKMTSIQSNDGASQIIINISSKQYTCTKVGNLQVTDKSTACFLYKLECGSVEHKPRALNEHTN